MVHRGDDTAAGGGARLNGLIQLERWQTPDADPVAYVAWSFEDSTKLNRVLLF